MAQPAIRADAVNAVMAISAFFMINFGKVREVTQPELNGYTKMNHTASSVYNHLFAYTKRPLKDRSAKRQPLRRGNANSFHLITVIQSNLADNQYD